MTIGDRIALIADGELVEEGSARDIYERPRRRFTADFIGENNVLDGRVAAVGDGEVRLDIGGATARVARSGAMVAEGATAAFSIRSERCRLFRPGETVPDDFEAIPASFIEERYVGLTISRLARLADGREVLVREFATDEPDRLVSGDEVQFCWRVADARLHLD